MSATLDDWFVREILPHEAALLRYLGRICPNPADIHDIRHDAYVRILEAADRLQPIAPKSLLFTTARRLLLDRMRRNRIVPIDLRGDFDDSDVLVDEVTPERRASILQQLVETSEAFNRLPSKCREVLWLRRVEGLSQRELATKLGISEGSVEKHLMRAARLLSDFFTDEAPGVGRTRGQRTQSRGQDHG